MSFWRQTSTCLGLRCLVASPWWIQHPWHETEAPSMNLLALSQPVVDLSLCNIANMVLWASLVWAVCLVVPWSRLDGPQTWQGVLQGAPNAQLLFCPYDALLRQTCPWCFSPWGLEWWMLSNFKCQTVMLGSCFQGKHYLDFVVKY